MMRAAIRFNAALQRSGASSLRNCGLRRFGSSSPSLSVPYFPGAIDSKLTYDMEWDVPQNAPIIPTFRVMDQDSQIQAKAGGRDVPPEDVMTWYKNMVTVNVLDSIMSDAQRHGRVSFYMVSAGEEALMVGSAAALRPSDIITTQYREHGVFLQRGYTLKDFMCQLTANEHDPGKGRSMPVHYSGKSKVGIHAVASTLGTQIPHAVGAGYALKMQDRVNENPSPRVAVAYFGEGASSEGDFHGALNLAAVMGSPTIFICRNNGFAISTPASQQYKGDGIASRGRGYGIESLRVDGSDIFAVYEATRLAREKALENGGRPILLEMMSYRLSHHSTSDDSSGYRKAEDVAHWRSISKEPVSRLRKWLCDQGHWDAERDDQLRKQIRREVISELTLAEKEKKPPLKAIFEDVYSELTDEAEAQRQELRRLMTKYPREYDIEDHSGGLGGL